MVFMNGARVSAAGRPSSGRDPTLLKDVTNHRRAHASVSSSPLPAASQRVKEARAEADKDQLFEVESQTTKWLARRHKFVRKIIQPEERERLRDLFDALDADGGGTINLPEFRQAFELMLASNTTADNNDDVVVVVKDKRSSKIHGASAAESVTTAVAGAGAGAAGAVTARR